MSKNLRPDTILVAGGRAIGAGEGEELRFKLALELIFAEPPPLSSSEPAGGLIVVGVDEV